MNIIVANKNIDILGSLDVDIIKNINGVYTAEEIGQSFSNFFFNKMFLDITSIKEYQNIDNMKVLSLKLDMDKIILFLGNIEVSDINNYISSLIKLGIYNFAYNKDDLIKLYNKSNTFNDVKDLVKDNIEYIDGKSDNKDFTVKSKNNTSKRVVIGIKNLTDNAGSTTMCYMLKKELEIYKKVVLLEINKTDFRYFREGNMYSITEDNIKFNLNKYIDFDIIIIDMNDMNDISVCDKIIYLIEPSTIKLNKVVMNNGNIFNKYKNNLLVLNKSLLSTKDVEEFMYEAGITIFDNIPPIDDKKGRYEELKKFIDKLDII